MKRRILFTVLFVLIIPQLGNACELCKKNQPKILENITHGPGPSGTTDYIITWSAVILVLFTLFYSIKYLVKPKESNPGHIKNIVIKEDV